MMRRCRAMGEPLQRASVGMWVIVGLDIFRSNAGSMSLRVGLCSGLGEMSAVSGKGRKGSQKRREGRRKKGEEQNLRPHSRIYSPHQIIRCI